MSFNNTYLCLKLKADGFLYDIYSNQIDGGTQRVIKSQEMLPTDMLLFYIYNYHKYKNYLDNDLRLQLEIISYRIDDDDEYDETKENKYVAVRFINNKCIHKIYYYSSFKNVFEREYLDEKYRYKTIEFSLEYMINQIKSPCVIYDHDTMGFEWYEDVINNIEQLQLTEFEQKYIKAIDAIYKHFTFKRVTCYGRKGTHKKDYYIMDARTNFCTKQATKTVG